MEFELEERQQEELKQTQKGDMLPPRKEELSEERELVLKGPSWYAPMPLMKKMADGKLSTTIACFVPAICTIVDSRIEKVDGEDAQVYEVVFEWNQKGETEIEPIFKKGKCINSTISFWAFDKLSECRAQVDELNAALFKDQSEKLPEAKRREAFTKFFAALKKATEVANKHIERVEPQSDNT